MQVQSQLTLLSGVECLQVLHSEVVEHQMQGALNVTGETMHPSMIAAVAGGAKSSGTSNTLATPRMSSTESTTNIVTRRTMSYA
jgi:hypothetical protein